MKTPTSIDEYIASFPPEVQGILERIRRQPCVHYHKDGSIWAKGKMRLGKCDGYWEWFRKDGTRSRSGYFEKGVQVGEWTTYDKNGAVYKVTTIKPKSKKAEE